MNTPTLACPCGGQLIHDGRWKMTKPMFGWSTCDRCGAEAIVYRGHGGALYLTRDEAARSFRAARAETAQEPTELIAVEQVSSWPDGRPQYQRVPVLRGDQMVKVATPKPVYDKQGEQLPGINWVRVPFYRTDRKTSDGLPIFSDTRAEQ